MELTPLEKVPVDFDATKVKGVFNPTEEAFTHTYGGKPLTIEAGAIAQFPEPIANLLAKHLAQKILRGANMEFLKKKFEGLDEFGREKWRVNEQHFINREDVEKAKEALIFEPQLGGPMPEVKMPETKFDGLSKKVDAEKSVKSGKQQIKKEDDDDEKIAKQVKEKRPE